MTTEEFVRWNDFRVEGYVVVCNSCHKEYWNKARAHRWISRHAQKQHGVNWVVVRREAIEMARRITREGI